MKPTKAIAILLVVGVAGIGVIEWRGRATPAVPEGTPIIGSDPSSTTVPGATTASVVSPPDGAPTLGMEAATVLAPESARPRGSGADRPIDQAGVEPRTRWPDTRIRSASDSRPAPQGQPAVAAELAFKALQYVGVDPEAEKTWRRAIDDPNMPPGVRSDLIEDLNQEGYLDNSRPTKEDLPLILARLELIERLAPYATDPVNVAAFEEAYKDLLAMYVRLGGEPRSGR